MKTLPDIILEALRSQEQSDHEDNLVLQREGEPNYHDSNWVHEVGSNLSDVCLDGHWDLNKLAKAIEDGLRAIGMEIRETVKTENKQ